MDTCNTWPGLGLSRRFASCSVAGLDFQALPVVLRTMVNGVKPGSLNRWAWYHIIPQLAGKIPLIYHLYIANLGDYISPIPPIKGTRNSY